MNTRLHRIAVSCAILVVCLLDPGRALAGVEDEIHAVEDARYDVMIRVDAPALAAILADEFLYHQLNGKVNDKSGYIAQMQSGDVKITSARRYDVSLHVYGSVVTVMGSTVVGLVMKGEAREVDLRYLNVWVKRDGRWQLVARQSAIKPKS